MNPHITELRKKAAALPLQPGVYMMKDKHGKIIYVGKSRKLKTVFPVILWVSTIARRSAWLRR